MSCLFHEMLTVSESAPECLQQQADGCHLQGFTKVGASFGYNIGGGSFMPVASCYKKVTAGGFDFYYSRW